MAIQVSLISNCDDAVIFWSIPKPIPDCWGFTIEKEIRLPDGQVERMTLDNRMGFEGDKPRQGEYRPSTEWPFQRFWWADHSADLGDTVRYRVTPMLRTAGKLLESVTGRSAWTGWTTLSGGKQDGFATFFNRGLVISQFMARYLEDLRVGQGLKTRKQALAAFKQSLGDHDLPIRQFLAGALRTTLLDLLEKARKQKQHVYAALYELEDEELIGALCKLGARAHLVLANGSITKKPGEDLAAARKRDQNKAGRKALKAAGAEVHGRFLSPGALGHNKFLVFADSAKRPFAVWTGSTNWTTTGLCTQINNGLLVTDGEVATQYADQWDRLQSAGNGFPEELVSANNQPAPFRRGKTSGEIWFTRTQKQVDLEAIDEVVNNAKEGVLFLMFQPGGSATLATVRKLQAAKPSLYIKGVVSTLPAAGDSGDGDASSAEVTVAGNELKKSFALDIVQPQGANAFANWAATVARNEFITMQGGVIGFAIVHSKLIVVDPFTDPVVITGSHNFSGSASKKNDENFMVIRGNQELATHYSAHILSVYHHYRWMALQRELQAKGTKLSGYLRESPKWQDGQLKGAKRRELDFWVR